MPELATITSFYSFTSGTKARAAQVNSNFSAFRGHIVPIDPNTQTCINNTYDLGSSDYYWKTGYIKTLYRAPVDSTATAAVNGFAASSYASGGPIIGSAAAFHIAGSTCTVTTIGRPVMLNFFNNSTTGAFIAGGQKNTSFVLGLIRDGITLTSEAFSINETNTSIIVSGVGTFDFVAAGAHVYSAYARTLIWTTTSTFNYGFRVGAFEL